MLETQKIRRKSVRFNKNKYNVRETTKMVKDVAVIRTDRTFAFYRTAFETWLGEDPYFEKVHRRKQMSPTRMDSAAIIQLKNNGVTKRN
jgi:hypothetical protein